MQQTSHIDRFPDDTEVHIMKQGKAFFNIPCERATGGHVEAPSIVTHLRAIPHTQNIPASAFRAVLTFDVARA